MAPAAANCAANRQAKRAGRVMRRGSGTACEKKRSAGTIPAFCSGCKDRRARPMVPPMPDSTAHLTRVRAVLGLTNTAKTHLAMTRLLAHASGIIGFPLRLLARENYDRMVAAKGERNVALITGEEKIVPPEAKLVRLHGGSDAARPAGRVRRGGRDPALRRPRPRPCLHRPPAPGPRHGRNHVPRRRNDPAAPPAPRSARRDRDPPAPQRLDVSGPTKLTRLPARSAVVAFSAGEVTPSPKRSAAAAAAARW